MYISPLHDGSRKFSHPFGPSLHGTMTNAIVQLDHIDMVISKIGRKHILMLRVNDSRYFSFYTYSSTNAETAIDCLIDMFEAL